jgi:hypothetical protein
MLGILEKSKLYIKNNLILELLQQALVYILIFLKTCSVRIWGSNTGSLRQVAVDSGAWELLSTFTLDSAYSETVTCEGPFTRVSEDQFQCQTL